MSGAWMVVAVVWGVAIAAVALSLAAARHAAPPVPSPPRPVLPPPPPRLELVVLGHVPGCPCPDCSLRQAQAAAVDAGAVFVQLVFRRVQA